MLRLTLISATDEKLLNNAPPEWITEMMEPDCFERVVRVQKDQPKE